MIDIKVKDLVESLTRRGFLTDSPDETPSLIVRGAIEQIIEEAIEEDRIRVASIITAIAGSNPVPAYKVNQKILSGEF